MPPTSLPYSSLTEVADQIARGDLDSITVTEALLSRIERLEPRLHSYITVTAQKAGARARR